MVDVDGQAISAAPPRLLEGEGDLVPLGRAARRLGKDPATLWRWRHDGVRVRGTDRRVKLRMVRLGGRWYIRPADLEAFAAAAAGDDVPVPPEVTAAIAVATDRPDRAERELRQRADVAAEALRRLAPNRRRPAGGAA